MICFVATDFVVLTACASIVILLDTVLKSAVFIYIYLYMHRNCTHIYVFRKALMNVI